MEREDKINKHPIMLLAGLLSLLVNVIFIYYYLSYSSVITIDCDRGNQQNQMCQITSDHLIYKNIEQYKLADIKEMKADYISNADNDSINLYLVVKDKESKEGNLLNGFAITVPEGKFQLTDNFNNFISNTKEPKFYRQYSNTKVPYICNGILMILLLLGVLHYAGAAMKKL